MAEASGAVPFIGAVRILRAVRWITGVTWRRMAFRGRVSTSLSGWDGDLLEGEAGSEWGSFADRVRLDLESDAWLVGSARRRLRAFGSASQA